MTNQNSAALAANDNPLSDGYVNAIIQRHGYDSPESVIAQLHQWIGLHGGEDTVTLLMYEAHKALSKLRAPVAGEPFMYGIMGPDGKAHLDEFCVSADPAELEQEVVAHMNEDHKGGKYSVVALFTNAAPQASAEAFDFVTHLARQAEFSARTFGPGARVAGVCDHIRKELIEVETSGGDLKEWVDVIILGLDGAWRSGATPKQIIAAIVAKQAKNEARTWPDWRTVDPNKAIEHQRNAAPCSCPSGDGSLRHPCPAHPKDKAGLDPIE